MTPLQKQVLTHVEYCIKHANQRLNKRLQIPTVNFNQRGKIAGTAHLQKWELRFNPILLAENPDAFLNGVVAHEVAHLVVFKLFGRVRPHGREWQLIMTEVFNVTPKTTHNFNVSSVAGTRYIYLCPCSEYPLTIRRHNKVKRGQASYYCRKCKQPLQFKTDIQ
ncbi:SprT family zinc-dependent metalloprotease [Photobacterium kishitanii]|uniref:SprT family zinc-dependent metalloprotease n=1 Tax=Photobacterium kishitanii TaxID=318456 RepID=UPI0005D30423|nr:SprT family zinc-dependent metalloprotease [Photobacterium kishitanii]KJG06201.1 SprT protein [Photobacterium kishitanii]PSV04476.1 SprT family zinc-dependent metalloprotease [Photobacterium kishitanii]PSV75929.1 SprT family zinc-dependent metalloprotease [Photobacterium kishitanii]